MATTTHEHTDHIAIKDIEKTLRTVIDSLIDGQEGFQKVGDEIKDETIKRYFLAESLKRASFRGELVARFSALAPACQRGQYRFARPRATIFRS